MSEQAIFPMTELNITNAYFTKAKTGAHRIKIALDLISKDGNFFAPFTGRIVKRQNPSTVGTVVLESCEKVQWADGSTDFMHVLCYHDNDISHLSMGQVIQQGAVYYHMGTKGGGTGPHVHMEVGRGMYPKAEVQAGTADGVVVWKTQKEVEPYKAFWVSTKTTITANDGGYAWRKTGQPPTPVPVTKIYGPGYITNDPVVGSIASFMRANFPSYSPATVLGNYYGPILTGVMKEFQKRTGMQADGITGPLTQDMLRKYGWKG